MRIAHVITKLDVGGAQTHVVELARGQAADGYQVDIVAGVSGPAATRAEAAGVGVLIVPELGDSHGRLSQRKALVGVTNALASMRPDVVHGHSSHAGLAARLAARRLHVPSVYTAHGWPFQKGAAWRQRAFSFAGEFVGGHVGDAVIVLTEAERERARRAHVVPERRLWVVPNGIADVPLGLRREPRVRREPVLIMVARFAPPKMQRDLLEVLRGLADIPFTVRLVGDGPELDVCRQMVAAHPELVDRVEMLGRRDDVAELLATSDIGVLWSRYEGLPMSVMEYMRAGLCCVTSDLPGTRTLFGDPPVGVVAADSASLSLQLTELLATAERIDALGQSARARYESAYSVGAMVAATGAVYAAVIGD